MGGSALPALITQSWPPLKVPFTVVRNYDLPSWVNEKTLVICDSVSGNTEETLEALRQAEAKGAQIAVITCGGALQHAAEAQQRATVVLPKAAQPRYAVLSNYQAVLAILSTAGVLASPTFSSDLVAAGEYLKGQTALWRADVPTKDNQAKQIAQELMGKSIVVYSGPKLFPAAYKWKISFNENAKQVAWVNQLPEFNHNEFIGWSKQPVDKPYAVIDLRSNLEHPRVQKRFEVSAQLLSGMRPEPIVVSVQGETLLQQMVWASALGDFVSIYLAILNGLNPAPVELVEKFKKTLAG
jgi:glucose/mannose-6-phosphate isomerase